MQVSTGGVIPPTHCPFEYPELALPVGSTQTFETVGMGTLVVVEGLLEEVVLGVVQTPAAAEVLVAAEPPTGGFLEM